MEKVKINKGILALLMITSIFGNWQTMINKYMDKFMNYFNSFSMKQDSINTQSNVMNQHIANNQPAMTSTTNTMDNANSNNNSNTI